ncbi:MAG: UbiA family prenyltransferase [Thermoplasmata archaeon]|nr:UbiA family prenyltransferase [Candidatus Sysuiplasma acidicola]MBX8646745.1 UbiA family prenyltransferase [Candidatus Sysuiplasma acidicola]
MSDGIGGMFRNYLRLIRYGNCAMSGVAAFLGAFVVSGTRLYSHVPAVSAAIVTVFLFTAAGNTLNDFLDADIDARAHPERPIPSGFIAREKARRLAYLLFAASVISSLFINAPALMIVILSLIIMLAYEFRLKKLGLTGNFSIAWLTASLFLFGAVSVGTPLPVWALFATSFAATLGREIIKDIQDREADSGIRKTLPMKIGDRKSMLISSIALLSAIAVSPFPYLLHQFGTGYLLIVIVADVLFAESAVLQVRSAARAQSTTKIAMYVALLAFLAGALGG